MSHDNLVQLETHRRAKQMIGRHSVGSEDRSRDADALLQRLRSKKRLPKNDQLAIACNIGRLIERLDDQNKLLLAKNTLRQEQWDKRKRYILFSGESGREGSRLAAAGGTFAGIVDALVKLRSSRGFDPTHAKTSTVYEILEGTSFRPWSQATIDHHGEDAASFIHYMDSVLKQLAREAQLGSYFDLISKYAVTPADDWPRTDLVVFEPARRPPNLFDWCYVTDYYELEYWIPWWAPKCVIGHLYIPLQAKRFSCTNQRLSAVRDCSIEELNEATWTDNKCWDSIDELVSPELIQSTTIYHRLPLWLMALPIENGFQWSLFASIGYRDDFQVNVSLRSEGSYFSYNNTVTPVFVDHVGSDLESDIVYFCEDTYDEFTRHHIAIAGDEIRVIGSALDSEIPNFRAEFYGPWLSENDLPPWLGEYPVQRFLKLTGIAVQAKNLALASRDFTNFDSGHQARTFDSLFRPAFCDPIEMAVPFTTNSIAAYLIRNFTFATESRIFDALKEDATAKSTAARAAVDSKLSKFRASFRGRFDE